MIEEGRGDRSHNLNLNAKHARRKQDYLLIGGSAWIASGKAASCLGIELPAYKADPSIIDRQHPFAAR